MKWTKRTDGKVWCEIIRIVAAILIGIMMDQFGVSGKEYVEITE